MRKFFWNITSWVYRKLGPRRAWLLVMSPPVVLLLKLIIALVGKRYFVIRTKYGFLIKLKIADYLFAGYLHLGETNPFETNILRTLLHKGDVFIDVGAHMGWFTLNASQAVSTQGKIFAFEPNPSVASWFRDNCELNHLRNIFLEETAVSDRNGMVTFWIGDIDSLGSLRRQNAARESIHSVRKLKRPCITLDHFADKHKLRKIKFIKVDAEGADLQVLKGGERILRKLSPYLLVEVFGLTQETDLYRDKDIVGYLTRLGYKPYELTETGLRPIKEDEVKSQLINLFFAKDDRELIKLGLINS